MISLPSAAQTHLMGDVLTIAFIVQIDKTNGTFLRLTSHSETVTVGGNSYYPDVGADATALKLTNNMSVGGGELSTIIKSAFITEEDVLGGYYNGAKFSIKFLDYTSPNAWQVVLMTGLIGEVTVEGEYFNAELRSLAQKLNKVIGEHYQPGCRAQLFDNRCKVSPTSYQYNGQITAIEDQDSITGTPDNKPANFFKYGRILWQTGANAGTVSEIKASAINGGISLFIPPNLPMQLGDTYIIREGCDKTFSTCKNKFSNHLNFRGEPHIPGIDRAFVTRI